MWALEELAKCKHDLDAVNLNELIEDLRQDGAAIVEKLIRELEAERDRKAELHDVCQFCYQDTPAASPPWNPENPSPRRCGSCGEDEE